MRSKYLIFLGLAPMISALCNRGKKGTIGFSQKKCIPSKAAQSMTFPYFLQLIILLPLSSITDRIMGLNLCLLPMFTCHLWLSHTLLLLLLLGLCLSPDRWHVHILLLTYSSIITHDRSQVNLDKCFIIFLSNSFVKQSKISPLAQRLKASVVNLSFCW